MRETFPTKLLLQLLQTTPEKLVAIERFLAGQPLSDPQGSSPPASQPACSQVARPAAGLSAAIEGDPASGHFCIRVTPADEASQAAPPEPSQPDEPNLSLAAKVFELLTALDPDSRLRKAPPIKVFNLYYRQRLEPAEIARLCHCNRSLVFNRLATIRKKVRWSPQQLQEVSPHVEVMQDALTDSRAEGIYRKGAAYGNEDDNQGDD